MLRLQEGTPCPGTTSLATSNHSKSRDSLSGLGGESTMNIEFTTEVRASLRNAAPRRRESGIGGGPRRRNAGTAFSIHEDQEVKSFSVAPSNPTAGLRSSIFSQPAQRFRPRVSFAPSEVRAQTALDTVDELPKAQFLTKTSVQSIVQPATRPSTQASIGHKEDVVVKDAIKKPARRGTIYIPSEDTTVPSIFMGVFSPIKSLEPGNIGENTNNDMQPELTGIAAQIVQKKSRRTSLVAEPPKRAPLTGPTRPVQGTLTIVDHHGNRTGKENVPPGWREGKKCLSEKEQEDILFDLSKPRKVHRSSIMPGVARRRSSIMPTQQPESTSSTSQIDNSIHRRTAARMSLAPPSRISETRAVRRQSMAPLANRSSSFLSSTQSNTFQRHQTHHPSEAQKGYQHHAIPIEKIPEPCKSNRVPEKIFVPRIPSFPVTDQYPLLQDGIVDASMYEDSWLSHQEIAITQLINNLFTASKGAGTSVSYDDLRSDLLRLYQVPGMGLLQKRLQAALMYGGLSIPKDVLAKGSRLVDDLGLKRRFLDLWMKTYDLTLLRAATEALFGRQCATTPRSSCNSPNQRSSPRPRSPGKRSLEKFLELFLLRNEDARSDGSSGWSYRRTTLRSLLLVLLLDQARTSPKCSFNDCLFQRNSTYNTSSSVLKALAEMLLPFAGDVTRHLSHLNYSISYVQYPLEEYEYGLENLAIELRDGVRLTRIVELLLYPSASHLLQDNSHGDTTTTVAMPTGEILSLTEGEHDWPLSQHLKFPCLGRATKMFNVELALSALKGVRGMGSTVQDIKAEDIVDGYREKTVALLWGLVGKWGLGSLIDWEDVRRETRRLNQSNDIEDDCSDQDDEDEPAQDLGYQGQKRLLKSWAEAIAVTRKIPVKNLTTSFADGRIFEAILNEYQPYLVGPHNSLPPSASLSQKLTALGCSKQFVNIFAYRGTAETSAPTVLDRDFTIAALAFLCSRLLLPSRRCRVAVSIQRKYKTILQRRLFTKQIMASRIARDCVTVVQARERLLWAKATILKAWRARAQRGPLSAGPTMRNTMPRAKEGKTKNDGIEKEESRPDILLSGDEESDIWLAL